MTATLTRQRPEARVDRPQRPTEPQKQAERRMPRRAIVAVAVFLFALVGWFTADDPPEGVPTTDVVVVDDYTEVGDPSAALYESLGMRWEF